MKKLLIIGIMLALIVGVVCISGCVSEQSANTQNTQPVVVQTPAPTPVSTPVPTKVSTPTPTKTQTPVPTKAVTPKPTQATQVSETKYVVNLNTNKVHKLTCRYAKDLENFKYVSSTDGYDKCKVCF